MNGNGELTITSHNIRRDRRRQSRSTADAITAIKIVPSPTMM
jgi:hypothetical protein